MATIEKYDSTAELIKAINNLSNEVRDLRITKERSDNNSLINAIESLRKTISFSRGGCRF